MSNIDLIFRLCGVAVIVSPTVLFAVIALPSLLSWKLSEKQISRCCEMAVLVGLFSSLLMLLLMLVTGKRYVPIEMGNWVILPGEHFHFQFKFVYDRLSVPFLILTYVLVGTTGAFANRYLHRERGYNRFFLIYAMFLLGMVVATLAGTIETLFFGWELVGLSSALLIAYFHERQAPVSNGYRVWTIYRFADASFLAASVALHHFHGAGVFSALMGEGAWPYGVSTLTPHQALVIGVLLLIAAAGKSALIPFSGWLPRAMEGPTPSSAIFYGALSVHLGTYLLLRVSPIFEQSIVLRVAVISLGILTALFATLASSVQSDVKTGLAFSSLTQVGIITAEIGFGFNYLALIHICGHACLRAIQLLTAPSLLRDYHSMENAIGDHLTSHNHHNTGFLPLSVRLRLYRFSFERGYFDSLLDEYLVKPFLYVFQTCDKFERRWTDYLTNDMSRESDSVPAVSLGSEDPS